MRRINAIFTVPDVEHIGDIEYYESLIRSAGGIVDRHSWSQEDGDNAYIYYHCDDRDELIQVKNILREQS
jgi:hypothetical protein